MKPSGLGKGLGALIPKKTAEEFSKELGIRVYELPVDQIKPNPRQPREQFSAQGLEGLRQSIASHGILQPLIVLRSGDWYELITGERRLRAAKLLGLKTVPAIVRTTTEQEKLEFALLENLQREDLNPIEEAKAFRALAEEFGLTHDEIARRVGKSRPAISNIIRLLELPADIQQALINRRISYTAGRALLGVSPEEQRRLFAQLMGGEKISSAVIEEKAVVKRGPDDPNLRAIEAQLRERLGTKVLIRRRGSGGVISIEFYSDEELRAIIDRF
ncbi:ParB/RepB/Spo0J family partition protein [Candidatus Uhrbacteria bacterium]|nr:ParB/RepB/Spo0J family partition protein [Candidatus Uhrbacteria bacterium]